VYFTGSQFNMRSRISFFPDLAGKIYASEGPSSPDCSQQRFYKYLDWKVACGINHKKLGCHTPAGAEGPHYYYPDVDRSTCA
jgi:hypothetical protein